MCGCGRNHDEQYDVLQNETIIEQTSEQESVSEDVKTPKEEQTEENTNEETTDIPKEVALNTPFYGIWIQASQNYEEIEKTRAEMEAQSIDARLMLTSDWENLNSEKWYVITAGIYETEDAAKEMLPVIQNYYPDAYVKYSGNYRGSNTSQIDITIYNIDQLQVMDNYILVSAIVAGFDRDVHLIIDGNTIFDDDCEMEYFGHYENGMSVIDWFRATYQIRINDSSDMSIIGVYNIDITDNHINKINGIYWWD